VPEGQVHAGGDAREGEDDPDGDPEGALRKQPRFCLAGWHAERARTLGGQREFSDPGAREQLPSLRAEAPSPAHSPNMRVARLAARIQTCAKRLPP
jgi:hypothetical protein